MPLAWLKPGDAAVLGDMPTEFGPVTLATRGTQDGRTLDVIWRPAFRSVLRRVMLHLPPVPGLKTVKINGKAQPVKGKRQVPL